MRPCGVFAMFTDFMTRCPGGRIWLAGTLAPPMLDRSWSCWWMLLLLIGLSAGTVSAGTKTRDGGNFFGNNWTAAGNWSANVAPVAGDDLVFPGGAPKVSNNNDYPALTIFNSITISSNNYSITG